MENSLRDEISCKSSIPPPIIFNSQCIRAEWPVSFEKNAFEILHLPYILLSWIVCQPDYSPISYVPVYYAEDLGSRRTRATFFYYL